MNFYSMVFSFFVMLISISIAPAQFQYDFFWSDRNLNEGAINDDFVVDLELGDVAQLYLYVTTNGPADANIGPGCGVDVSTSSQGVIQFNSAESFDFDIVVTAIPSVVIGTRWLDPSGDGGFAGPASVKPDFIDMLWAFTVSNFGVQESNNGSGAFVDTGYDAQADAFLFGKVTLTAIGPGNVSLMTVTDESGCVDNGQVVTPVYGGLSVNVVGQSCLLGDVNDDGVVDLLDVPAFVQALLDMEFSCQADINEDGLLDLQDVDPFVEFLLGG